LTKLLNPAIEILERLVSFQSISGTPTREIIDYIENYLSEHGVTSTLSFDNSRERANLFATIGPQTNGGVIFNGHTDVVPVTGQHWATDPFKLTRNGDRLYGRGAVDMKGFLACVLACVPTWVAANLVKPIHIAFSYDEEIGGYGMPVLLDSMQQMRVEPDFVIVGEPTQMKIVAGHKGGYEMRTEITGHAVHSCNPHTGVNAINIATRFISRLQEIATRFANAPHIDSPYDPPFCTINVGTIEGGTARNATAGWCNFNWEFRPMPGENGQSVIDEMTNFANTELLPDMRAIHTDADIKIVTEAPVPALDDSRSSAAADFVSQISGINSRDVVSFGTDAGYFSEAGFSTVVFGPGDINRAHKPDEYIEVKELAAGLEFLEQVSQHFCNDKNLAI